jgi:FkbM family methyltransferase
MPKLESFRRIIKTTGNSWQVPLLKVSMKKRKVHFKNGITLQLNYADYCIMRDLFYTLDKHDFKVKKSSQDYAFTKSQPPFNCIVPSTERIPFFKFLTLLNSYSWSIHQTDDSTFKVEKATLSFKIKQLSNGLYYAKSDNVSIIGPMESLMVYLVDGEEGIYEYDYKGKTVLDVGGYCGESAVFFGGRGAKKVIIYEPVEAHHELIQKNISLNRVNAELHKEGLGDKNGSLNINYDLTNLGFGLLSTGKKTLTIAIRSAQDIISQSHADIAKIDCEGAELALVGVPSDNLRLIDYYIIETHTNAIKEAITKKFLESGFRQDRAPRHFENEIYMIYFKRT